MGSFAKFDQSIRLHVEKIFAPPSQAGAQLQSGVSRSEITRDYSRYNLANKQKMYHFKAFIF